MDLTVPNALSDISLECNDGTLYVSKLLLALRFGYFHTMFMGSIPFVGDTVHLEFSTRTMLQLIHNKTSFKNSDANLTEQLVEHFQATDFLDAQDFHELYVPTHIMKQIINAVYPQYVNYITVESFEKYVDSEVFDHCTAPYRLVRYVKYTNFLNFTRAYVYDGYDLETLTAPCLNRFRRLDSNQKEQIRGELILLFVKLPIDKFHEFCLEIQK